MRALRVGRGMPMRDAIRAAELLGCSIESGHRGGEIRFRHVLVVDSAVCHQARKDAPWRLVTWLLGIAARVERLRNVFGLSRAA